MRKSHPLLVGIENVVPYRTVTGHSLYDVRPPAMQIDQFLTVGGVMGMTSYPGVGKTWLGMEAARAVASGTPFLGRYRATRGGVLFVGSDSSLADYARQWTRLTRSTPDAHEVFEPVRFLIQSTFMFEDRDEVRKLIRTHQSYEWGDVSVTDEGPQRERGFHVIVFDTLSRLTRAQQNDNTEMEEVFRNIRWIAEATNAAVILLHHNSKKSEFNDGSDWRGAMSQIGALDSWVQLVPHRRDKHLVGIQFKKFRGITPEDFAFRMNVTDAEGASLVATDEAVTAGQRLQFNPLTDALLAYLAAHPGSRAVEMRDALWEKFQTGVDAGGTTLAFDSKLKFLRAINNRLQWMLTKGERSPVRQTTNSAGKTVYTLAPSSDAAPAPATQEPVKKPRKRKKK